LRTELKLFVRLNRMMAVFVSRHERSPRSWSIALVSKAGPVQNLHSTMNMFLPSWRIRMSVLPS
jgi:hypothetical protein